MSQVVKHIYYRPLVDFAPRNYYRVSKQIHRVVTILDSPV